MHVKVVRVDRFLSLGLCLHCRVVDTLLGCVLLHAQYNSGPVRAFKDERAYLRHQMEQSAHYYATRAYAMQPHVCSNGKHSAHSLSEAACEWMYCQNLWPWISSRFSAHMPSWIIQLMKKNFHQTLLRQTEWPMVTPTF